MALGVSEKGIQSAILDYLTMRGHFVWKTGTGAFRASYNGQERYVRMGAKGCPDIIGVHKKNGLMIAIEVKKPGSKLRDEQVVFLSEIKDRGAIAFVAYGLEDVLAHQL